MEAVKDFDFENLFIFEIANNHQGSVEHGLKIINAVSDIAQKTKIRAAVKLQFRELDSFVHPRHRKNSDNKHIPRFLATRLSEEQFSILIKEIKLHNLISIVTPFDEPSVEMIERLKVEVIKIGSCSANDWPLLKRISKTEKPVICSTAGLCIQDIDKVVSFLQHKNMHFALMHCVALYPTFFNKLQLNQIENLRSRYPGIEIGFSTHEKPEDTDGIKVAYAKGARLFEKHIAIPTELFKINTYSATPEQALDWVIACKKTMEMCGAVNRVPVDFLERNSLLSLSRGVYAKKNICAGDTIRDEDIYLAMPPEEGQLLSREWRSGLIANQNYVTDEAISSIVGENYALSKGGVIATIIHELKGMLNTAHVPVGTPPNLELSHHYGLHRFREYGAAIIDCINREYGNKIIIQLPGQAHPSHFHKKKEEAFRGLYGELVVEIGGTKKTLKPGNVLVVPRLTWHSFTTEKGAIFEEISTTHFNDDSFYMDEEINKIKREDRKTKLINWGENQLDQLV